MTTNNYNSQLFNIFKTKTPVIKLDESITILNNLGIDIYNSIYDKTKLISPLHIYVSIMNMLKVIDNKNIYNTLNIKNYNNILMEIDELKKILNTRNIKSMNAIFVDNSIILNNEIKNILEDDYYIESVINDKNTLDGINEWIIKRINKKMLNTLDKLDGLINVLSVLSFYSKLKKSYKTIIKKINDKSIEYLEKVDIYRYYQDEKTIFIEQDYIDTNYSLGIISFSDTREYISMDLINDLISRTNNTELKLIIPKIFHKYNINIKDVLNDLDLQLIYNKRGGLTKLVNKKIETDRIYYNTLFTFDGKGVIEQEINNKVITIELDDIIYYVRYRPSNILLLIGRYNTYNYIQQQ